MSTAAPTKTWTKTAERPLRSVAKSLGVYLFAHFVGVPVPWHAVRQHWPLVLPLATLVYLLFAGYTPIFAGTMGLALTVVLTVVVPRVERPAVDGAESRRGRRPAGGLPSPP